MDLLSNTRPLLHPPPSPGHLDFPCLPSLLFCVVDRYCFSWGTRPSITDTHTHTHASNLIAKARCLGMSRVFHETNVTSRGLVCAELSFVCLFFSLFFLSPSVVVFMCWQSNYGLFLDGSSNGWYFRIPHCVVSCLCSSRLSFLNYSISNGNSQQQTASSIGICR